jgi:hypothetical protein
MSQLPDTTLEVTRADGYVLSSDVSRLDYERIHAWISGDCYWAIGRGYDVVRGSVENSLAFGVYVPGDEGAWEQIAFARVVTDYCLPPSPPKPSPSLSSLTLPPPPFFSLFHSPA